jgi:hypothetical protein
MKRAGNTYEVNRKKRIDEVDYLRLAARAVRALDAEIQRLELAEQESAAEVANKTTYAPPMGAPPIPKFISPFPVGRGLDANLNSDGFVSSRSSRVSRKSVPRRKY